VPLFPSEEWCAAVVAAASADPQAAEAAAGFAGDVAVVVEGSPFFAAWGRIGGGRILEWRVLRDADEVDELAPAYLARASLATWRGLFEGRIDPVEAILERKLRVAGDLSPLVERIRFKGVAGRVLDRVETRFDAGGER
jgi:hypothetical protein